MTDAEIKTTLAQAVHGLLLTSESDFPLKPFVWTAAEFGSALTADALRAHGHYAADAPVEQKPAADFFADLTRVVPQAGDDQRKSAEQFAALQTRMNTLLTGLIVFRVGAIKIDVYIVGKTPDGDWAGVSSKQVET